MSDLLPQLLPPEVDQSELEHLLLQHFKGARATTPEEITYPGHETDYALRLEYRDGVLVAITTGPRFTDRDLATLKEHVERELVARGEIRFGRWVLFSSVPVDGFFRYRDLLQIIPAPPEAPRPPFQLGEHPFLLEFGFHASTNFQIRQFRLLFRARELELILSALLEFSISGMPRTARHHWVLTNPEHVGDWHVRYLQEMYAWKGNRAEVDEFTAVAGLQELRPVAPAEYYSRTGIEADRHLEIPGNLDDLLDIVFSLSRPAWHRFLRACFWFQHARAIYLDSRSASYTAVLSAIEALMPPQGGSETCEQCGRPIGAGPTQQFADFVERHAPGSGLTGPERKRIYAIRSALSHGGALLHSDRYSWSPGLTYAGIRERQDIDTAWRLVRAILVHWLHAIPS